MVWVGFRRDDETARATLEDPEAPGELFEGDEEHERSVDLDKAWHGLHWLLTGSSEDTSDVVSQAILGGEPIGEDHGYGPPRLLSAADVRGVAEHLRAIDLEALRARMDPVAMERADLYPGIWGEEDLFDDFVAPAYEQLRSFYLAAAAADESVIQLLT